MDDIHQFLNRAFDSESINSGFPRACLLFKPDLPKDIAIKEGERAIRRLVMRRSDYRPSYDRVWREGKPYNWLDHKVIEWAFDLRHRKTRLDETGQCKGCKGEGCGICRYTGKAQITDGYLAGILRRSVDEVKALINKGKGVGFFNVR